jgi:hypothetical protein
VRSEWLNPVTIDPEPPRILLHLGAAVPDLTGLTADQAAEALTARGLGMRTAPEGTDETWTVGSQRPAEGTLIQIGATVFVALEQADVVVPAEPSDDTEGRPTTRDLVAAGVAVLILFVIVAIALTIRGRRSRAVSGPNGTSGIQAPNLRVTESQPAPGITVRLEPRHDPGTVTVKEKRR